MAKEVTFKLNLRVDGKDVVKKVTMDIDELQKAIGNAKTESDKLRDSLIKYNQINETVRSVSDGFAQLSGYLNDVTEESRSFGGEVKRLEDMQKSEQLVIEALAFIRGRSLSETYCIIDEAQNLTPHEIKTIITRAGEGTKMVFTGDIQQIDQPYLDSQSNGLVYMIDRMRDQNLFAHVNLVKGERSQLSELASNLM